MFDQSLEIAELILDTRFVVYEVQRHAENDFDVFLRDQLQSLRQAIVLSDRAICLRLPLDVIAELLFKAKCYGCEWRDPMRLLRLRTGDHAEPVMKEAAVFV